MHVRGIDITSAPSNRKPITVADCLIELGVLSVQSCSAVPSREAFISELQRPGPWIAGLDFPFGQSRRFLENVGQADSWEDYVHQFGSMERREWVASLDDYKRDRPDGDKQHKRRVDVLAGGASPQTHSYTPVGLMFHFAAPLLLESGVHVPGLTEGGEDGRIIVEAYPGVLVRDGIGKVSYKHDDPRKQSIQHIEARERIVDYLSSSDFDDVFGFTVSTGTIATEAIEDPTGDVLDAVLCAAQAAWAWTMRDSAFGYPTDFDPLEGWIPQPTLAVAE